MKAVRPFLNVARNRRLSVAAFHTSSSLSLPTTKVTTPWADPASRQYKFWNREADPDKGKYSYLIEVSPESIQKNARIISLAEERDDDASLPLHKGELPLGSSLLGVGTTLKDFDSIRDTNPNVLFVSPSCPKAVSVLPQVLAAFPSIEWVHCRSAGIDFIDSPEFANIATSNSVHVTNAKGQFSSSLAEYAIFAMSYFAKDLPRLMRQKKDKNYEKYDVEELRGKTLGIVGYGDVGRACAKLATVYGMRIVALRRHPFLSKFDPHCDEVFGRDKSSLNKLMSESDYIVCSAPSTYETRGMVNADAFEAVKENAVFINLGRGPVVDEKAMIAALKTGKLKGAALDVFAEEPLPKDNELWDLPNVLISPHNMDQTSTFVSTRSCAAAAASRSWCISPHTLFADARGYGVLSQ
jgi:phosphoglycerate dehydrogenase-like enzyme